MDAVVLVPVKALDVAKSRLRSEYGTATGSLALAMVRDVVASAQACRAVAGTVVITDDGEVAAACMLLGATVEQDRPGAGLNAALRWAAHQARTLRPDSLIIAQPADVPSVRPEDLAALVGTCRAAGGPVFVADADGSGTTALAAPPGADLEPRYGPGSREAHRRSGARELMGPAWTRLRRDVDTAADLAEAVALGVGPSTLQWLRGHAAAAR